MALPSRGLLAATLLALLVLLAGTAWNAISLRRLRLELASQRDGAGGGAARVASSGASEFATLPPGLPSTVEAVGWRGRRALILHVEGAAQGAPVRPEAKPRPQGDFYVARRTSVASTLNPLAGGDAEASVLTAPILGRLLAIDPDAPPAVIASLATRWELSRDGLECVYSLRRGVQFADGRPFTSADVLFSLDVLRDPALPADQARAVLADVVSLRAPDAFTVVATFRERNWRAPLLLGLALRILNKGWYEEEMPGWASRMGLRDVSIIPGREGFAAAFRAIRIPCPGTGPYYFAAEDFLPDQPVELVRNPFSWAMQVHPERHNFDGLRWLTIAEDRVALEMLKSGQIDSLVIDPAQGEDALAQDAALGAAATLHEVDHSALGALALAWNCRRPPFDDARVRRAMTHALDRDALLREVERGRGVVPSGPAKSTDPQSAPGTSPWPHDAAVARQLLAEAGWADTNGDGQLDREGKSFEVSVLVGSTRALHEETARRLALACAALGVKVNVVNVNRATFEARLDGRAFDAALVETPRTEPWDAWSDFHSSQDGPGGGNLAGWRDADEVLDGMRAELDATRRHAMAHRFHAMFHEQQPWTMILEPRIGVLISSRIEGVRIRPTGIHVFDMHVPPERILRN